LEGDQDVAGFVDRLERRVGTDLRCVIAYGDDAYDVRYRRDDLRRDEFELVREEMAQRIRTVARTAESSTDAAPHTLVSCYGDLSVLHVRCGDRKHIAVLVTADATPRIQGFARELRERRSA